MSPWFGFPSDRETLVEALKELLPADKAEKIILLLDRYISEKLSDFRDSLQQRDR